jgi:hypothetical protein
MRKSTRRTKAYTVRFNAQEKDLVMSAAKRAGLPVAAWVREVSAARAAWIMGSLEQGRLR